MLKVKSFFTLIFIFIFAQNACAEINLIRDAETEKFLRELTQPIFKAAGLKSENIKIYIVNDNSINAFVSGGQNVFINTGLIRKYKTPDALIGVIAHESGHITAGHLARSSEGEQEAQNAMFLSYLLGIGAAIAGSPDAGMAMIAGGSQSAQRIYMKFTRTQEEAADQQALQYLDEMHYPADGLVNLLESFESQMIGYKDQIDEYLMSHPISRKRIDLIKARTAGKNFSDKKINSQLQPQMDQVLAKLEGFMEDPESLLRKYKNQNDIRAKYIKAIAFHRKAKTSEALQLLDEVIAINSKDGFLFELKGEILFGAGDVENSIIAYNQAIKLLPKKDAALAKISFSSSILTLKKSDETLINLAIKRLVEAKEIENENPFLFKQLATAFSKINDEPRSLLALAEFSLLTDNKENCLKYAKEAKEKLDKSQKHEILRADDLIELAKNDKKKESEKE
jgi:predicted Zn-dependent protease